MANHERNEHDTLKRELINTISHEFRTPLCVFRNIISNTLAGTMGEISEKLKAHLIIADKEIGRLAGIINDFVDISQIDDGNMELHVKKFAMQAAVDKAITSIEPLAAAKNLRLTVESPDGNLWVEADYKRIVQVLTSLITNAIKCTPDGGRVTVQLQDLETDIFIEVEDHGIGMSEDAISKIFNRIVPIEHFTNHSDHARGLELSVARSLVEMHGGRIWAESTISRGSTFCFTLPKTRSSVAPDAKSDCLAAV